MAPNRHTLNAELVCGLRFAHEGLCSDALLAPAPASSGEHAFCSSACSPAYSCCSRTPSAGLCDSALLQPALASPGERPVYRTVRVAEVGPTVRRKWSWREGSVTAEEVSGFWNPHFLVTCCRGWAEGRGSPSWHEGSVAAEQVSGV